MDRTANDERSYFLERSERHLAAARQCADAAARELHERFADAYARRAEALVDQD